MKLLFRLTQLALPLIPFALFELAHRFPRVTDALYSQGVYPIVATVMGALFNVEQSVAEIIVSVGIALITLWSIYRVVRARMNRKKDTSDDASFVRRGLRFAIWIWFVSGGVFLLFLMLWGFNYARPTLASRMDLAHEEIRSKDVLALGIDYAKRANLAHQQAALPTESASAIPFDFDELNGAIDRAFARRQIPGDRIRSTGMPVKPLSSSLALSYLGLSGIFIPFTGEPSINALQPDAAIPFVTAHEKAHQHAITNEGEASFVAFLVCSDPNAPPYLRYSAYLMASSRLLSAAARDHTEEEMSQAWQHLGAGPLRDIEAMQEFWRRFQGLGTDVAERVNDRYLHSMRVPGGVRSYDAVVELLVAWERSQPSAP